MSGATLHLTTTPSVAEAVAAVKDGTHKEVVVFGPRGEGKSWGALIAAIAHATEHQRRGFPLPVKWLGPTGTFEAHKNKTHDTLRAPGWAGCWRLEDQGHRAKFVLNGTAMVDLRLFGAGDQDGLDRLRAEAHCAWFEEPAPAAEIGARGMTEDHWGMGRTSLRLPTHANVALCTSNYPDEMHWTWRRWMGTPRKDTLVVRIPPRERTTAEQAAEWAQAIKDPVMRRRLLEGQPGTLMPGRPVAEGFNDLVHVAKAPLVPLPGGKLYLGQDGGLMPATVIAQKRGRRIEILAALASEHAGLWQHLRYTVIPWLGEHAPWVLNRRDLVRVCYDPTIDTGSQADITTNALRVMQGLLPGSYRPGQNTPWSWRRDPLLVALASLEDGQPLLTVDPGASLLIRAWRGLWHYSVNYDGAVRREQPKKPNPPWADVGDASAYLLADMAPLSLQVPDAPRPPRNYQRDARGRLKLLGQV